MTDRSTSWSCAVCNLTLSPSKGLKNVVDLRSRAAYEGKSFAEHEFGTAGLRIVAQRSTESGTDYSCVFFSELLCFFVLSFAEFAFDLRCCVIRLA